MEGMPSLTLREIAERLGGRLLGPDRVITGVQPLESAAPGDLSFLAHPRYRPQLESCMAGGVLVGPGVEMPDRSLVVVDRPYVALAKVMAFFHPPRRPPSGVSPRASVAPDCQMGRGVSIGAFVTIAEGCRIGDRVILMPGVTLGETVRIGEDSILFPSVTVGDGCVLGARVVVHAGSVVGSDGFGYAEDAGAHLKIPQVGNVVVEDDVEIGANVTLDRATFGSTRIRKGTKIDNLVQVGHNCDVGENSILVAQVGLSGSVRLGRGVIFAGQSGSVGHVTVGEGTRVGAKSAVTKDLPPRSYVIGHPARDHREWKRAQAALANLPSLNRRIAELEEQVAKLSGRKKD